MCLSCPRSYSFLSAYLPNDAFYWYYYFVPRHRMCARPRYFSFLGAYLPNDVFYWYYVLDQEMK